MLCQIPSWARHVLAITQLMFDTLTLWSPLFSLNGCLLNCNGLPPILLLYGTQCYAEVLSKQEFYCLGYFAYSPWCIEECVDGA